MPVSLLNPCPLDNYSIPHTTAGVNTFSGRKFYNKNKNFLLDKLLGVWYNGNSRPKNRGRATEKKDCYCLAVQQVNVIPVSESSKSKVQYTSPVKLSMT